jgi:hypothetical protein
MVRYGSYLLVGALTCLILNTILFLYSVNTSVWYHANTNEDAPPDSFTQLPPSKKAEPDLKLFKDTNNNNRKIAADANDECQWPHKRDLLRHPVQLKDMSSSTIYHPEPGPTRCYVPWEWTNDEKKADALIYNTLHHHANNKFSEGNLKVIFNDCQHRVLLSVESPIYYPLMLNAKEYGFDVSMDFRLHSDVPVPYVPSNYMYLIKKMPLPTAEKSKDVFIAAFMSNCAARNNRDKIVGHLEKHVKVHNYGSCRNNIELPPLQKGQGWVGQKLEVLRKYKFTLAFENSNFPDYVTEKFFQPLQEGSVPVYLGADNIDDFAPNSKAVIKVSDFGTIKDLAKYLSYLNQNDTAYEEHLVWKYDRSTWTDRYLKTVNIGRMDGHCRLAMFLAGLYTNSMK